MNEKNKELHRSFCEKHPEVPIFLQYDWLNTLVPQEDWGVVIAGKEDQLKGFLVYYMKRKFGFRKITLPPLTPFLGPWIIYPEGQKLTQRIGHEKKVMDELIEQLPPYDELVLHFHPSISNWLPFYWKGFDEQTRYTYVLKDLNDLDSIFEGLKGNTRSKVRKAEKHFEVVASQDISPLHQLKIKEYAHKGLQLTYSEGYFQKMDELLASKGNRKILYAQDQEGTIHAGIYLVEDLEFCYDLISSTDPETKGKDAMTLLVWKGIEHASSQGLPFNFEGSMIEPIETFFRSFGAHQLPYHKIMKTPSFFLRGRDAIKTVLGRN